MSRPYKVIVIPDLQCPFEDKKSLAAVEKYMASSLWDEVIYIGDFLDMYPLASFNRNAMRKVEGKTVQKEYDAGNVILDRHQSLIRKRNPKAKFTFLVGNHEDRIRRYIDEFPQLEGILNIEIGLRFKQRGIKAVWCYPKGEVYSIGNAYFHHGLYTGQNPAKKMVENYGVNIFFGHVHSMETHSKVLWGKGKAVVGQSLGCLCRYDLDYVGQNPKSWQHGFGVFFFLPNGQFTYYTPRIFNGVFIGPDGVTYSGQ